MRRINRLTLFWFDSLDAYQNKRSLWLAALRNRVEAAWQAWALQDVCDARRRRWLLLGWLGLCAFAACWVWLISIG
jgi:uncharacterized membrane protein